MPESQSRCEFKRNPLDVGLAAAGEGWATSSCPGLVFSLLFFPSSPFRLPNRSFSCWFFQSCSLVAKDERGKGFMVVVEPFGGASPVLSDPVSVFKGLVAARD